MCVQWRNPIFAQENITVVKYLNVPIFSIVEDYFLRDMNAKMNTGSIEK